MDAKVRQSLPCTFQLVGFALRFFSYDPLLQVMTWWSYWSVVWRLWVVSDKTLQNKKKWPEKLAFSSKHLNHYLSFVNFSFIHSFFSFCLHTCIIIIIIISKWTHFFWWGFHFHLYNYGTLMLKLTFWAIEYNKLFCIFTRKMLKRVYKGHSFSSKFVILSVPKFPLK